MADTPIEEQAEPEISWMSDSRGYTLTIKKRNALSRSIYFTYQSNGEEILVTGRRIQDYERPIREMPLFPNRQYVEVGAGLGEFVPHLLRTVKDLAHKPIVIDPADYSLMHDMLSEAAESSDIDPITRNKLYVMRDRARTILDRSRVRLVNKTLLRALDEDPDLKGCADVVIDNFGASIYPNSEWPVSEEYFVANGFFLGEMEKQLLRPGGLHFNTLFSLKENPFLESA